MTFRHVQSDMSRSTREMAYTKTSRKAHHLNVVGDFYVEEDCCLCCGGKDEATVQRILEVAVIDVIDGKPSESSPKSWWRRFFGPR